MAKTANVGTRVWVDEFDISGFLNSFSQDVTQEVVDVTCFGDAGPRRVVGNYDHKHGHTGFFDGDEDSFDQYVFEELNTDEDHYLSRLIGSNSEGATAYLTSVRLSDQARKGSVGGAVMLDFNAQGSGPLARGVLLANAALSGTGNRTGRNMGATISGQLLVVHFHLFAFDGTNITLKVQESSDDDMDTYADITGLTSGALTVPGVVRKTTTAVTEAYKRVAITGTFTTATIGVVAGLAAGQ